MTLEQLEEQNERILQLSLEVLNLEISYHNMYEAQKKLELTTSVTVSKEVDGGKKKFSNGEQRQEEVDARLVKDLVYQKREEEMPITYLKKETKRIELQFLKDQLINFRLFASIPILSNYAVTNNVTEPKVEPNMDGVEVYK